MMQVMIRTPIFLAIAAIAAPAHAAPTGVGWKVDTGGAVFGVANRALRAINARDVAAITDDTRGSRYRVEPSDPSRIGLATVETGDRRSGATLARISARLAF